METPASSPIIWRSVCGSTVLLFGELLPCSLIRCLILACCPNNATMGPYCFANLRLTLHITAWFLWTSVCSLCLTESRYVPLHLSVCQSDSTLCTNGTFSMDWFIEQTGVWGQLQEGLFNKWQVFDIEYRNRRGHAASDGPGNRFPFVALGLLSLKIAVMESRVGVAPDCGDPGSFRESPFGSCWGDGWWKEQWQSWLAVGELTGD